MLLGNKLKGGILVAYRGGVACKRSSIKWCQIRFTIFLPLKTGGSNFVPEGARLSLVHRTKYSA